ncbi:ATP-binding protein [Vibrio sp. S17_S38]|nr:ATP-binding protein [Vibrio sp. S17_S38]
MPISLTLIRGFPGSGKSTLARKLTQETGAIHLETDMYFVDSTGQYRFDFKKLNQAHKWCQQQTRQHLEQGFSAIVSNTFVCQWEMLAYKDIAQAVGAELYIQVCREQFGSIHNIEAKTIANMKQKWEE